MPTFDSPGAWPPGERASYVSGASTTSNYVTMPQFRAMYSGDRKAIITSILMACSGRGGSRTMRYYLGNGWSAYGTVAAAGSAQDYTHGVNINVAAGASWSFGMEVNGAFYVGTDYGSGSAVVARFGYIECPTRPGTPTFSSVGQSSMNVNWTAPSDNGGSAVNGYTVQIAENSSFSSGRISYKVGGSTLTKAFSGLDPNTTYYARVLAHNKVTDAFSDYGQVSLTSSVKTDPGTPSAPQNTKATETSPTTTKIDWATPSSNGGSAITGYSLQYSQSSTFASGVTTVPLGVVLTYTTPALAVGTWYFRVRAINANGNGSYGSTVSNKIDAILGLPKVRLSGAFVQKPMKARVGGAFVQKPLKVYTAGAWKVVN